MRPNRFQIQRDQLAAQGPQKWLDTLLPKVMRLRAELAQRDPRDIAKKSGAMLFDDRTLELIVWSKTHTIAFSDCIVREGDGAETRLDRQLLMLMYLTIADGAPPANRWLRYRELNGGMFYSHAFHGYAEERLAQTFHGEPEKFSLTAMRAGGTLLSFGNSAAFEFVAMPRIRLGAVLWSGDEDFPSSATILFDASANHYLPTDVVGALGSQLVSRLMGVSDDAGETLTALAVQPPKT
jgi:hypothetical protein